MITRLYFFANRNGISLIRRPEYIPFDAERIKTTLKLGYNDLYGTIDIGSI